MVHFLLFSPDSPCLEAKLASATSDQNRSPHFGEDQRPHCVGRVSSLNSRVRCLQVVRSYVGCDWLGTTRQSGIHSTSAGTGLFGRSIADSARAHVIHARSFVSFLFRLACNFLNRLFIVRAAGDIRADRGNRRETSPKFAEDSR